MQTQSSYSIVTATIIFSGVDVEKFSIDVRNNIASIELFEDIDKPFIDGRLILIDDFGFRSQMNTQGTERLILGIASQEEPANPIVYKTFFFSRINDVIRKDERTESLSLDLVEEHVYLNAVKQLSRSYTDTIENVINNICARDLKKVVRTVSFKPTAQGTRKFLIPYMSPIEAIQWIKTRATSRIGSPIYLYGDTYSDNLYLSDWENLMKEEPINKELPFRYNLSAKNVDDNLALYRPYYEIQQMTPVGYDNTLEQFEMGGVGSYYENLDAGTGMIQGGHISIRDIVDELKTSEILPKNVVQDIFDPSLEIDGKLSDEHNSMYIHQVTSTGTYNQFSSYHDEALQLDIQDDLIESKLRVKNKILRQVIKRKQYDITMDGIAFFKGKINVGQKVRLLTLGSNVANEKADSRDQIDRRKSGDYLIMAIAHKIVGNHHKVVARLSKINDLTDDFTL